MQFQYSERAKHIQGAAIEEILRYAGDPTVISLAGGNPASETFPSKELAQIAKEILEMEPTLALQYNVPRGYLPLRELLQKRSKERDGAGREFDDLVIVSGAQQAIDLVTKVLCNEGDVVLVEEPSYIGALNAFRSYNTKLVGVPMEKDGVSVEKLEQAIAENRNVKIFYTIPSFHNPTGITMSAEKRRAVYELCVKHRIVILEDNPYGELTFDGVKQPTIKSMDTEGIVAYCNSFSKILAPGLRVGYVIAHRDLIAKVMDNKQINDVHTGMLPQLMALEYLRRYDIDAAIVKMRALYRRKCNVMLDAIEQFFPSQVTHTTPAGGLFVWCDMRGGYDTRAIAGRCAEQKVVFVPGSTFMTDMEKPCSAFRLNYSTMSDERIVEGVELLGRALRTIMAN